MLSAPPLTPPTEGPLSQVHYRDLALAEGRFKKVHSAARVAAFNGWMLGAAAALSAPFALFSVAGAVTTLGLAIVAFNEFRGRRRLLRMDPSGATRLGWNQLGLLAMIVVYCIWMLWTALTGPSPLAAELQTQPELGEALGSLDGIDELYQQIAVAFYGAIVLISLVVQGLTAWYYFTRRNLVEGCRRDTPAWILRLQLD